MVRLIGASIAMGIMLSSEALAVCTCSCVGGMARPICTSPLDIAPFCPPTVCGIVPPSVQPIQPPYVPPVGTSVCSPRQVFNPYSGRYEWRQLCY